MFYKKITSEKRDILIPIYDYVNQEILYFVVYSQGLYYPIRNVDDYEFRFCLFKRFLLKQNYNKYKDIIDIETMASFDVAKSKKYKEIALGFSSFYGCLFELNNILTESSMIKILKGYEDIFSIDDSVISKGGFNFWNNDVNRAMSIISGNKLNYKDHTYIVDYSPLFTKTKRITGMSDIDVNKISDDNMLKYNDELERFDFNAYIPTVLADIVDYDYPNKDFYEFLGEVLSNGKRKYQNIDRKKVKELVFYMMFSNSKDDSCMFFKKISDIKYSLDEGKSVSLKSGKKINGSMYSNAFTYFSHQAETEMTCKIINFLHLNNVDIKFLHYDAFFLDKNLLSDNLVNEIYNNFKMRLKK